MRLRRFVVLSSLGAATVLSLASVAWACNPEGMVPKASIGVSPSSAPAGSTIRVTGSNWEDSTVVAVNLGGTRLGDAASSGDGRFSLTVPVPAGSAIGLHTVTASGGTRQAEFTFNVTEPATTNTGAAPADSTGSGDPVASLPSGRVSGARTPAPDSGSASIAPAGSAVPAQATGDPSTAPVGADAATEVPAGQVAGATGRGSLPPGARSAARPGAPAISAGRPAASAGVAPGAGEQPAEQLSVRTAQGDVWSGFATGQAGNTRARGLADLATSAPHSGPSPMTVGAGLAVLGVLAMFAGFATAEVGRRRVPVLADRRPER